MHDAATAQKGLARLCEWTDPSLLWSLWTVALRMARLIYRFRRGTICPSKVSEFERAVNTLSRELGRRVIEWVYNHLEPRDPELLPRYLFWEGGHYRIKRPSADSKPQHPLGSHSPVPLSL